LIWKEPSCGVEKIALCTEEHPSRQREQTEGVRGGGGGGERRRGAQRTYSYTLVWVGVGTSTRVWRTFVGFHEKVWKTAGKRFLVSRSIAERSWST
jgi:hypothetical protein